MSANIQLSRDLGKVKVKGKWVNLADLMTIDQDNLDNEYATQAAWFAYFSNEAAEAEYRLSVAKTERERVYAEADLEMRESLAKSGIKVTEGMVKSEVLIDNAYCKTVDAELAAKKEYNALKAIVSALHQRSSMLISLGAHRRAEMEMTGMTVRDLEQDKISKELKRSLNTRSG